MTTHPFQVLFRAEDCRTRILLTGHSTGDFSNADPSLWEEFFEILCDGPIKSMLRCEGLRESLFAWCVGAMDFNLLSLFHHWDDRFFSGLEFHGMFNLD